MFGRCTAFFVFGISVLVLSDWRRVELNSIGVDDNNSTGRSCENVKNNTTQNMEEKKHKPLPQSSQCARATRPRPGRPPRAGRRH